MILKFIFDRVFSLLGLILLSPFFLGLFVIHKIKMHGGRFFYRQVRIGKDAKPFRIFKIRTMKENSEQGGSISVYDDERVLPFGKWLRETKIDTLFELINVLIGDMSFVGPRPDVPGYADRLEGDDRRLLKLRPGITGPASLKYRHEDRILAEQADPKRYNDEVIYPDKVKINLQYLDNWSIFLDLKILWKTFF
ncbi:MAG: sugar transferase [Bacteroidales bacterium]|nr:sugar transferase [Bacteroidales bacterium]